MAQQRGVILRPESLADLPNHPLLTAKHSQLATGVQPRGSKIPPLVPAYRQKAVFLAKGAADIPCGLLGKLANAIFLRTEMQQPVEVPQHARFLHGAFTSDTGTGDNEVPQVQSNKRKLDDEEIWTYQVTFGLPWSCEQFIQKACEAGHPSAANHAVPRDLQVALDKHMEWSERTLVEYRMSWCRNWLRRAKELESAERLDAAARPVHVKAATSGKRLLLTAEILQSIGYEDMEALELLREGSPLAGDIPKSAVFEELYKPCMMTVQQLERDAGHRNKAILATCKTCGDPTVDRQLLDETLEEVRLGWAIGPISDVPADAVISRRFPLVQRAKTRMIDDYSISGINDTAAAHNKVDLHMVDTFAAVTREFFRRCEEAGVCSSLLAKTYDLRSAYRQVPVRTDHLKYSYFAIYNCELDRAEVYQLLTLPFGATHSVYSFLRLSRMLYSIATRALFLLTTNFYDDFILASMPNSTESAKNSMELVFLLTGWLFAMDGKKCTTFGNVCKALGVEFDLTKSGERVLAIRNTEQRMEDLLTTIASTLQSGSLGKHEALALRGRLGFADSFLHGRLGALLLKQLSDHAYGRTTRMSNELVLALNMMAHRLKVGRPRVITARPLQQWFVYTDAAYEPDTKSGGIGAALFSCQGECIAWFGFQLCEEQCNFFGASAKNTIIYELELTASILALDFWASRMKDGLQICFGDNDGARFSLIRGSCLSRFATCLMEHHLHREAANNLCTWFARVPTEANISDYPSRAEEHELLPHRLDESASAVRWFEDMQKSLQRRLDEKNVGSSHQRPL